LSRRNWTNAQKNAIKAREGSVLVSAAAGSGKTAVLVQRVIEILTDKKNICEANKLLIVTFTKAAAFEMRDRINERLSELIRENPKDSFLKRQQILLSSAHISTIHSFCNSLIKDNFYKLNIPKDFKIADNSEITLLRDDAINEVFEENYKSGRKSFLNLIEIFANDKNDKKLVEIINSLYDFVRSHPFPEKWLDEKLKMYDFNLSTEKTVFGEIILNHTESLLNYCLNALEALKRLVSEEEKLSVYLSSFEQESAILQTIKNSLHEVSWNEIADKINVFNLSTLKRVTGEGDNPIKLKVMAVRKQIKSIIAEIKSLFSENDIDCKNDTKKLLPIVEELFLLVKEFSKKLDELKKKASICDFGDLEHLTINLLVSPCENGFEKTEDAIELSEKFKYIMIDECQDINAAQDMIFKAISKNESNLFTVGDVKQSIYRFRQAMPEIFLKRKESYNAFDENSPNYPAKIILDKNFRSRKEILNAVNFIFRKIMSKKIGEMEYTNEEELRLGSDFENIDQDYSVEFKVLDLSTKSDDESLNEVEAKYISAQIYKLISQGYKIKDKDGYRPVTFKDFCILLRNSNKHAKSFAKEMSSCGIPVVYDDSGGFFSTIEISVITSLLNIIDNPIQDIPLISVLLSPIANFSIDDLTFIRAKNPDSALYFALLEYSEKNEKAKIFLNKLKKWRALASTMQSDELINYIYEDSGYMCIVQAMNFGEIRLNNLRLLLEYARNFESNGKKGLSNFIKFIDRLKEQKIDLNSASSFSGLDNAVRIMSIHKSKGLEFPICFLANCSRQFNKDREEVLLHPNFGIGIKLFDEKREFRYNSYHRKAVKIELENSAISEELRVLYVALTRAKEKLFLISSLKNPEKTISNLANKTLSVSKVDPYIVKTSSSFSDWLILSSLCEFSNDLIYNSENLIEFLNKKITAFNFDFVDLSDLNWQTSENFSNNKKNESNQNLFELDFDDKLLNIMSKRFSYKYKFEKLSEIPNKVTVTDIVSGQNNMNLDFSKSPNFSLKENITPAQLGTAMHTFLQFADFKSAKENLKEELQRLVFCGHLSEEICQKLNLHNLGRFLNSDLVSRILKSSEVKKEFEFSVRMPLKDYDASLSDKYNDENIILQGSIDCVFKEDNEWIVVDYKTDKFKSIEEIQNKYAKQLDLYSKALKKCTNVNVKQNILYLFYTGDQILL